MHKLLIAMLFASVLAHGQIINPGGGSGSGVGSGASPVMAFYLAPQCPAANTGQCYQTPANTQVQNTCTVSTSNSNVVCPANTFVAGDVGKKLFGSSGCNPFGSNSTILYNAPVTINSFTSNTTVVVSSVALSNAAFACIVWGNPDDTAAAALDTFMASGANTGWICPKVFLSAAQYMFTTPHFYSNPAGCLNLPSLTGGQAQGNMYLSNGFELEGRGPATTVIWTPPDFPESGACNHGAANDACFAVPLEGRFIGFQIAGTSFNAGTSAYLINVDVGSLEYFTCTGERATGVEVTHWAQLQQINISECGTTGMSIGSGALSYGNRVSIENNSPAGLSDANLYVSGRFVCYYCLFYGSQNGTNNAVGIGSAATGSVTLYEPAFNINGGTNAYGYVCRASGCYLKIISSSASFGMNATANPVTNFNGIYCGANTCTVDVQGLTLAAKGTGNTYNASSASSIFINRGGNNFTGGAGISNTGFVLNLDSQGVAGITAAKAVLNASWGSTAAWTSLQGGNSFSGVITASGTGQAANPTITYTFPTPLFAAPSVCNAVQNGGTQANGTFVASSVSATGATFTYSGTPGAGNTVNVAIFCQ